MQNQEIQEVVNSIKEDVAVKDVKHNKYSRRGHGKSTPKPERTSGETKSSVKTYAVNVFYPSTVARPGRHKYFASHYEVNLMPQALGAVAGRQVLDAALTNEQQIYLGGSQFHQQVYQAALATQAHFLNNAGPIEPLLNAFYNYMYNSRSMYALLVTAWRCQQLVNTVDEDGLALAPLLSNHELKNFTQGWSAQSFMDEVNYQNYVTPASHQAMCFSSATSNGVWKSRILAPVLSGVRLPKAMLQWVEEKFSGIFAVEPTDFSATPRFVVLWPDGHLINPTTNDFQNALNYTEAGGDLSLQVTLGNATVNADLGAIVDNFTAYNYALMTAFPQLETMFDILHMTCGDFNFSRDVDGKTLPIKLSSSISKFIRSASAPIYAGNNGNYYPSYGFATGTGYSSNFFAVERDPNVRYLSMKEFTITAGLYANSNIVYTDRVEIDEADYALCFGRIAPLSVAMLIRSSSNNNFRWVAPLVLVMYDTYKATGGLTAGDSVQAFNESNCLLAQEGAVLSRFRHDYSGSPNAAGFITSAPNYNRANVCFTLKDYAVSTTDFEAWRLTFADTLSVYLN